MGENNQELEPVVSRGLGEPRFLELQVQCPDTCLGKVWQVLKLLCCPRISDSVNKLLNFMSISHCNMTMVWLLKNGYRVYNKYLCIHVFMWHA